MTPNTVHFWLDSTLWSGLSVDETRRRLQLIIDECNAVWIRSKTSVRWNLGTVNFSPEQCPKSNSPTPGPGEGYPYHVQLVAGGRGSLLYSTDGGVCAWNLRCAGLKDDRTDVAFVQLVNDILHEFGHVKQGEGYFCITFRDYDEQAPKLPDADIRHGTPDSLRYWKTDERRLEYMSDPMVRTAPLDRLKFSTVNAALLDTPGMGWNKLPSNLVFRVTLGGKPVKGAKFILWDCECSGMAEEAKLYWRAETDADGVVKAQYDYNDGGLPADNVTDRDARYRMWKVYWGTHATGNYLSIIDLWEAAHEGKEELRVDIELDPGALPGPDPEPEPNPEPEDPGTSALAQRVFDIENQLTGAKRDVVNLRNQFTEFESKLAQFKGWVAQL